MKDWIPVVSALVGFLAGISGTWLTQRSARQIEADRWHREQRRSADQEVRQLHIDVAEHIENHIRLLKDSEVATKTGDPAKLTVHRSQIGGRIKIYGSNVLAVGWEEFQATLDHIDYEFDQGLVKTHHDMQDVATLADETLIPTAVVTGEVVLQIIRSELTSDNLYWLVLHMRWTLPDIARYQTAFRKLLKSVSEAKISRFADPSTLVEFIRAARPGA
jgi:hypothetical protein